MSLSGHGHVFTKSGFVHVQIEKSTSLYNFLAVRVVIAMCLAKTEDEQADSRLNVEVVATDE